MRNDYLASKSKIKEFSCSEYSINGLLQSFIRDGTCSLLFLNSVKKIQIGYINGNFKEISATFNITDKVIMKPDEENPWYKTVKNSMNWEIWENSLVTIVKKLKENTYTE